MLGIRTRLLLLPERTDVTMQEREGGDGSLALVHIDAAQRLLHININRLEIGSLRPTLIVANALALVLARHIREIDALRNLTPVLSMLDTALLVDGGAAAAHASVPSVADPAALLQPLLDRLEVTSIDHVSLRRGVVGELLHPFDTVLLQLTPLRRFYAGELVAFRDRDGQHRYGQVVRDESAAQAPDSDFGSASASGADHIQSFVLQM